MCNIYCLCTVTVDARTRLNVALYVQYIAWLVTQNLWLKMLISNCTVLKFKEDCVFLI